MILDAHDDAAAPGRGRPGEALILVTEDEPEIADILTAYLERAGLRVVRAEDGRRALDLHMTLRPDLVLLDVQLPRLDGWQVLAEIRHRGNTPVIMLTALDQDIDKLMGLRIGADDYVVKPFNPAEVVARVQAVLRRCGGEGSASSQRVLRFSPLRIDLDGHQALIERADGGSLPLDLTLTEYRLLVHLARMPKRVFTRMELLEACLPEGEALERTVDSHLSKLRKKLEAQGVAGVPANVRGVGYRLGDV
ncbi:response regulator [Niveispirillum sp. SYP-B3756]|uniref:response regulator n=1 Tax=Niveispirillum sp. SYP-B3756 TaxID=2662178 RepID=UPI00156537FB|nr:response regulator [Niveispirillum sp. SYP-B3756]